MRKYVLYPVAALALAGAFIAGTVLRPALDKDKSSPKPSASAPAPAQQPRDARASAGGAVPSMMLPDFANLVERNGPAVVNITVIARSRGSTGVPGMPELDPEDPFSQFFRRFGVPQPEERIQQGQGSGFIVRKDGIILTNAHVISGATKVLVKLTDRREFSAKVLGVDSRTDIAVIKIEAADLPVVTLGSSETVKVGQWVVAIGAPFGFENSVTSGIVSAKSRSVPGDDSAVPFIQTDVAVNPGNSGGPLFDLQGAVIGINSQIYSRSGGYQGISFAIPIETALNVQKQILQTGKVRHGRLGVRVQPLTQELATAFGLQSPDGALVGQVESGSPAERAGLKNGDVILQVDEVHITGPGQLAAAIAAMMPDTKVKLTLWRDRHKQEIVAKLGGEEAQSAGSDAQPGGGAEESGRLGLSVRPLTPAERRQSGLENGLVVEEAAGAAAFAGIQAGDVVVAVNGKPLRTVDELRAAVRATGKGTLALLVQRGDGQFYVPVKIG